MRLITLAFLVFATVHIPTVGDEPTDARGKVAAVRRILDGWHADQPENGERFLHLVCWTPADRELPGDYQARRTRIMEHIRGFYAREMERIGFGARSFNLN